MHIVVILLTIGGILLFLAGTMLLIRRLSSSGKGLIPNAPANICRCCYEPEAPFSGGICRACVYVRTIGTIEETLLLESYEHEILQQDAMN